MSLGHTILILFVIIIWGFNFVVAKTGLEVFPPLFMMALRFGIVALALVWFAPRPKGMWKQIAILSVTMGSLHFSLMFIGLTKGGKNSITCPGESRPSARKSPDSRRPSPMPASSSAIRPVSRPPLAASIRRAAS